MSEWTDGYRAALADVAHLAHSRGTQSAADLTALLADIERDAFVIEHEQANRIQRRRLAAAREVLREATLPLFEADP